MSNGARIIDGKLFAAGLRLKIKGEVKRLQAECGLNPGLAVIVAGNDPASLVYVANKAKMTKEVGMASFEYRLDDKVSESELLHLIAKLNADKKVNGILTQLPLPSHLNDQAVINAIDPAKDVDGFHVVNVGRLAAGFSDAMAPCTPLGCLKLLKDQLGDLSGQKALVVGRSNIVGKPMALLLLRENCTVTMAHSKTLDLAHECRQADILVAAAGVPCMIKGHWIKPGATVIDVGIVRIPAPEKGEGKTRLVGDVDFEQAAKVAGAITPVPGGVGPITIACLLGNTLIAACRQRGIKAPLI